MSASPSPSNGPHRPSKKQAEIKLGPAIASLIVLRGSMDAAYRAPVPYLTLIAASFGVGIESAGWLAIALSLAGLVAPVVGIVEGRVGRRTMSIIASGLFILTCALMPFAPTFAAVLVLYVAVGVATALFTPQVQAFIGDVVPFAKRGTAIGFVELSWALGWIVGVPLFGFLIARASWWSSFLVFGAIGLLGLVLVLRFAIKPPTLNPQGLSQTATDARRDPEGLAHLDVDSIRRVLRNGPAIRMLLFSLLIIFSAQLATQVYAPHLLQTFNLDVVQLGLVSIVLGVADIVAEVGTIVLVDRVGKRRSVLISCVLFAAACLLVIVGRDALWPIMAALFLVFLAFEFCIVASLAMKSEVAPDARTTMIGFTVAASSLGRIIGSAIALPLFALGGLTPVMLVASGFTALAAVVCWPVRVGE